MIRNELRLRLRRALLGLLGRAVGGHGLLPEERPQIERDLRTLGFRKTARSLLVRRMARSGLEQGEMTVIARALDGLFTIACAGDDFGVGWEILERGTYEPHVVAFYRRVLRRGMTVLDVGANVGFHALHAATLVRPGGRVVAVEPDARNASLLRLALSMNDSLPVEVIEAALADADRELVLSDLGNRANSGARFTHRDRSVLDKLVHGPDPRFQSVRALRWDDGHLDLPVDLVKLDVEGFEPRVVCGMERSLERHRPIVLSEYAPSNLVNLGGTEPSAYLSWFLKRGYHCSILDEESAALVPGTDEAIAAHLRGRHHIDLVFSPR